MNAPSRLPTPAQGGAIFALTTKLASHFDMVNVDPRELVETLKQTAFRTPNGAVPSDAQMTALLIVANQYQLNPWTKEIYAFPAKGGGIVPIVGVDGWANIINSHPEFDGMEFEYEWSQEKNARSVTCVIYRKDRSKPTKVTEFFEECYRNTEPWNGMGRRMLRHKAMIQCGRLAFGYGGIHDPEEGETIAGEKFMGMADEVPPAPPAPPAPYDQAAFEKNLPAWRKLIEAGRKTADEVIATVEAKAPLTDAQKAEIHAIKAAAAPSPTSAPAATPAASPASQVQDVTPKVTYAVIADAIQKSEDHDQLDAAKALIEQIADEGQRGELTRIADERGEKLAF